MQLSKQLLILSDFVFLSCMCNQKVMCVSGDFFFFFFCHGNCSAGSSYYCYIHLSLLT